MFGLGTTEIVIIALILVFLFGGRKIPELMRGVTDSIKEFKEGAKEDGDKKEDDSE